MDALWCYHGSPWDPPDGVRQSCKQEIDEAARVLVVDGVFLMISLRPSHFLKPRVRNVAWQAEPSIESIGDFYSFVVARKTSEVF